MRRLCERVDRDEKASVERTNRREGEEEADRKRMEIVDRDSSGSKEKEVMQRGVKDQKEEAERGKNTEERIQTNIGEKEKR